MDPGQTVYDQRVLYLAFNVTSLLRPGHNALGALTGNSKYGWLDIWCNRTALGGSDGCRTFIMTLLVELVNGTTLEFHTDSHWFKRHGPIT